jgi:DNA-binding GntR family transcriptional regulator
VSEAEGSTRLSPVRATRDPATLGSAVFDTILDALMDGRIRAGDRLIMDRLADDFDVSRTPVRDALQRLYREGVIEPAGRRGYVVREASVRDTTHFYEARMAVEGSAAAKLARSGPASFRILRASLDGIVGRPPSSTYEWFDANRQFHRGLVAVTGNSYLLDMFDTIWNRSRTAVTYGQFAAANPQEDFRRDHEELIEAIETSHEEDARREMIAHIRHGLVRTCRDAGAE